MDTTQDQPLSRFLGARYLRLACLWEVLICLFILVAWLVWTRTPYWPNNEGGPDKIGMIVAAGGLVFWTASLAGHRLVLRAVRPFWFVATGVASFYALSQFRGLTIELRSLNYYLVYKLELGESLSEDLEVALMMFWTVLCVGSMLIAMWPIVNPRNAGPGKAR